MSDGSTLPKSRRTQGERSEAMRQRLIDATLECLETDGYAGTTISRIIEVAGVSRGAPVHHFPSKNALIAAAAEQLIRRIYIQLGEAVTHLEQSDNRLNDLILVSWRAVFNQPGNKALNELLLASQRDEELARILRDLWTLAYSTVGVAANHYLEPLTEKDDVGQLMVLTQWLLRGMAMDRHLVTGEGLYDHYLGLWGTILSLHMRARPGVQGPPPRPEFWDETLSDL